jgi:V/A-type H+-transporting ATPase subunit K
LCGISLQFWGWIRKSINWGNNELKKGVDKMMKIIVVIIAGLIPMIPAVIYFTRKRSSSKAGTTRRLVNGMKVFNLVVSLMVAGFGLVWLASPQTVMAAGLAQAATVADPYASLAAALATGIATISAGYAVSSTGAAAVGAIAEKPETFGRALVFVGLAEGIGIYGLIIAVLILNR